MRKLSVEEIIEINRLYDSGLSQDEVAKKMHRGLSTIQIYISNPKPMGRYNKVSTEQLQMINKDYQAGMKYKNLATKYSLNRSTICGYIWEPNRNKGRVN